MEPAIPEHVDVLVVGAGIYGMFLAREAAARGWKVALIDAGDFGACSSANSLKTIHGGLRYLQSFDLASCKASIQEQNAWRAMSPELVKPLPCILSTQLSLTKNPLAVGAGLLLYNLLYRGLSEVGRDNVMPAGKLVSASYVRRYVPEIKGLTALGGALWYDAQVTNTERFSWLLLHNLMSSGVSVHNYCRALDIQSRLDGANAEHSVLVDDQYSGQRHQISARVVVDCTSAGRWLESQFEPIPDLSFVKAVNLVIADRLVEQAVGMVAQSGQGQSRLLFAAPWQERTLFGTWYYPSNGFEDDVLSSTERAKCIAEANTCFSKSVIEARQVSQVHLGHLPVGTRTMRDKGPDHAFIKQAIIRDWGEDATERRGVFSLVGTKYTLARLGAEQAAERVASYLEESSHFRPKAKTFYPISMADEASIECLSGLGVSQAQCAYIGQYFGALTEHIAESCSRDTANLAPIPGYDCCIRAVLVCVLEYEQVRTLVDLLARRLPVGNDAMPPAQTVEYCLGRMAELYGWCAERCEQEQQALCVHYMKQAH